MPTQQVRWSQILILIGLMGLVVGGLFALGESRRSEQLPDEPVKLTFQGVERELPGRFVVLRGPDAVGISMRFHVPAGSFILIFPLDRFPVTEALTLPDDAEVADLNDLGRLQLVIDGESWTFERVVVHELILEAGVLRGRITGTVATWEVTEEQPPRIKPGTRRTEAVELLIQQRVEVLTQ